MSLHDLLATVGGFTVSFCLLRLLWKCWCLYSEFILSEHWQVDLRTYGKWAVVTGATSGIGKAYAEELARRGLDVVLVSRSDLKLQRVAKEIENKFGRKTRIIQADFAEGDSIYPAIADALRDLEIGILVNNVGMMYNEHFAYFLDCGPDAAKRITQVLNCNMMSVTQMTRLVLPDMVARKTGLIINLSSITGVRPQPLLSLYSATKAFVIFFSRCLQAEYKSKGVTIQCVAPSLVSTNMTHNIKVNCCVKSASAFAREALNTVGQSSYTNGCLSHALQNVALALFLPDWLRLSTYFVKKQINSKFLTDESAQSFY
uniref:Very-long-chain 3-oxoacyl-CoA reductase-like n=1 Tax=Salarias fasciatus TaxID=181472 RepID=A0A672JQV0_SALFA